MGWVGVVVFGLHMVIEFARILGKGERYSHEEHSCKKRVWTHGEIQRKVSKETEVGNVGRECRSIWECIVCGFGLAINRMAGLGVMLDFKMSFFLFR